MSETEVKLNHFQLLIGAHFDATKNIKYVAGDIIITERDLAKSFGSDKFRRLGRKEVAALETPDGKPAADTLKLNRKKIAKPKKMRFGKK